MLHCELDWERNTLVFFLDDTDRHTNTATQRINGTSKVFFFVMHHYETVKLSKRKILALWLQSWQRNYLKNTLSCFTDGGGAQRLLNNKLLQVSNWKVNTMSRFLDNWNVCSEKLI